MKTNLRALKNVLFLLIFFTSLAGAQPPLKFTTLASGFDKPVELAFAGDQRIFIGENKGLIKVFDGTDILPTPFLDLTGKTNATGNGGLLSIAFHPDYATNGFFFVYYTEKTNSLRTSGAITLARYKVSSNPNVADAASEVILMKILKPVKTDGSIALEHNGGKLNFGKDGNLYFATGDGMEAYPGDPFFTSQNLGSLLGKMIRIDVNNFKKAPYYTVPADNPFKFANPGNAKEEIWSVGLRNPFRWSFDRKTGDMFIGDVGQDKWEEIDYAPHKNPITAFLQWLQAIFFGKGQRNDVDNFGWSCYEGTDPYNTSKCNSKQTFTFPIYEYPHNVVNGENQATSVTGGYVYRGSQIPDLYGYYIAADLFSGNMYLMKKNTGDKWETSIQKSVHEGITAFGEDKNGELYAASIINGEIYKVGVNTAALRGVKQKVSPDTLTHAMLEAPITESKSLINESADFKIYPSITTNGSFKVVLNKPATLLQVLGLNGSLLYAKDLKKLSGTIRVDVPKLTKGMYVIKVVTATGIETKKLIVQ